MILIVRYNIMSWLLFAMRYLIFLTLLSLIYAYGFELPKNNWEEVYRQVKDRDTVKSLFELTDDFKVVEFEGDKLRLEPRAFVKKITISGNRSFWDSEIMGITGLRENSPVDIEVLENIPLRIKQFYYDRGYFATQVKLSYSKSGNWLNINIDIQEGKKSVLREIRFKVDQLLPSSDLETFRKAMGLEYGKSYGFNAIQEAVESLRNYLADAGYYDSIVEVDRIDADIDGNLALDISIDLGTKFTVKFEGVRSIEEEKLKNLVTFKDGGFSYYQVGQTLQNIVSAYQDMGFLDVKVGFEVQESDERFEDLYPLSSVVYFYIDEGRRFTVNNLQVHTDVDGLEKKLMKFIQKGAFYGRRGLVDFLEKTAQNLKKEGYIMASYRIDETPLEDGQVDVKVELFKKQRYILESIELENFPFKKRGLIPRLPRVYNPLELLDLQDRLKKKVVDEGFRDAQVLLDTQTTEVNGTAQIKAVYRFELGERYRNGFMFVYGSRHLNPSVVVNQFDGPERYFSNIRTELGLERLYFSRLFESVNLYLIDDPVEKRVNRAVILHDDKRGLFQGSAGYSTDQQFKVSVLGVFKNLFNHGFEFSGYLEKSNFQTSYKASFGNRLLPKNFSSFVSAYTTQQFRRYFDLNQDGFELSVEKRHNLWVNSVLSVSRYNVDITKTAIDTDLKTYRIDKVYYLITDDHRDQRVDPKDGYVLSLKLEKTFGQTDLFKGEFGGRLFYSPFEAVVVSLRISGGYIFSGINSVPLGERYFIGGITSLRGFALEEVAGKNRTGGNSFVLLNSDFRFMVYPRYSLYVFVFVDAGNVYAAGDEAKNLYLRKSAGAGLYVPTPVGALVFDVARKLDPKPGEDLYRLEFSIGMNF